MKIQTTLLLFILSIGLYMAPVRPAQALSCAQTFPLIGIVDAIAVHDTYTEFTLERFYTFDTSDWSTNSGISIDRYEDIVTEYIGNDFQLTEQSSGEYNPGQFGKITIPAVAHEHTEIAVGDILIKGPPFHVCSYRFTGVFGADGNLKKVLVNDDYQDYSYKNSILEVETGRELECDGDECAMEVNYTLDGESFALSPGQVHEPVSGSISSIHLLKSSDLKKRKDGTTIFDWGFSTYVTYVLDFSDSPAHSGQQSNQIEGMNFFQRIWLWLKSLFG